MQGIIFKMRRNMKFKYIASLILAAGIAAGCTETSKMVPEAYQAPLFLQASDSKIVFDKEGGKALVTIATNAEAWNYEIASGDWFNISTDEDSCIVVEAKLNNGAVKADAVTITAEKGTESAQVLLKITQRADDALNLSESGTANCYIVKTGGTYKFRCDIKGNGGKDGKTHYIETEGLEIKDAAYAELLWEARNDGDRTMSYEIIDGTPTYGGGYISFATGRSEGNALIAIKNSMGKVLWSWHIWVTDNDVTAHDHIDADGNVVAQIMDRNLGALNNTPMDINNRGMIYQMGRKDPFIPSRSPYKDYSGITDYEDAEQTAGYCDNDPEWNKQNFEIGDGTGAWEIAPNFKAQASFSAPGNIPYATANPMRFLVSYYSSGADWYINTSDEDSVRPGLWAEEKTIFDPCPPGYKVPGKNMWGTVVGNDKANTGGKHNDYDENGVSEKFAWNVEKDCGRVWKATGDFYPMVGNIYPTTYSVNTTPYNYCSGQTFYLTSQEGLFDSDKSNQNCTHFVASFNGYWAYYERRAQVYTGQVRCVKE